MSLRATFERSAAESSTSHNSSSDAMWDVIFLHVIVRTEPQTHQVSPMTRLE